MNPINWKTIVSLGLYDVFKSYNSRKRETRIQNAELLEMFQRQKESDYITENRRKLKELQAKLKANK